LNHVVVSVVDVNQLVEVTFAAVQIVVFFGVAVVRLEHCVENME